MRVLAVCLLYMVLGNGPIMSQQPASMALSRLLEYDDRPVRGAAEPDPDVVALVRNIISYSGLEMNFIIEPRPGIRNASATMRDGRRLLVYDPAYLNRIADAAKTDWARLGVLAHEIGHHLQGHLVGDDVVRDDELAADRYASFVLGLMGATLEQAQAHQLLLSEEGGVSHPPRNERLDATRQGWQRAQNLVVRRQGIMKGNQCPIIRLDQPAMREAVFALSLDGEFVPTRLILKWGFDDTVWGAYEAAGALRKVSGRMSPDGSLRLEQYAGCVIIGTFDLKLDPQNKSNETWSGLCTPADEGKPFAVALISSKPPEMGKKSEVRKK